MKPDTDQAFASASRAIAASFATRFAAMGMTGDEIANLCGAALGEILAQHLGEFGAAERLRDIADLLEGQVLRGAAGHA